MAVPVSTGTTGGGGAPTNDGSGGRSHNRHSRDGGKIHGGGPAMGSRLHGNYRGGRRFPAGREAAAHPQTTGTHKRRAAAGDPTIVIPATAGIHGGGRRWVPVSTRERREAAAHPQTTGDGGRSHNRHSRDGGKIHGGGPAMGSRLHGNYGRRRRTHKRQWAAGDPTIVIPATAGIHRGGRRWVPVSTRERREAAAHPQTTGGGGRSHNRHSRDGGNPQRGGPAMGSRLHGNDGRRRRRTHKRREAAGDPTIVIPATAGIHGGGRRWGSRLHGNERTHKRRAAAAGAPTNDGAAGDPTIVIPATAGIHRRGAGDGVPSPRERRAAAAHPQTTGGGGRSHNRHSRDGGNPQRGPAMGSRLHGNDGRRRRTHKQHWRRAIPQSSFPRRRESTEGGRRWGPVSTGTTVGGGRRTHKLRAAAAHPQSPGVGRSIRPINSEQLR